MKTSFMLLLLFATACQQTNQYADDPLLMENYKVIGLDNTIRRSLSDVWINTSSFCQGSPDSNADCARQLDALQRELNDLNPIPVPQANAALPTTIADATRQYRQFVAGHKDAPILSVFQQLYPRILLNKYGLINSTDYGLIAYYTQQLTLSNSLDFETRTQALRVLRGYLPSGPYTDLLTQTIRAATQEQVRRRATIKRFQQQMASLAGPFDPRNPETYQLGLHQKIIARYRDPALDSSLAQLRRLEAALPPPGSR